MFKTIILVVALTFACLAGDAKIYTEDGTYLGKLNDNKYDAESVSNPYGKYGSKYSATSINNPYGKYYVEPPKVEVDTSSFVNPFKFEDY